MRTAMPGDFTDWRKITVIETENLSYDEKKRRLYLDQKKLLDTFLEHGAISKAQYDKSLGDMTEKMGMKSELSNESGS